MPMAAKNWRLPPPPPPLRRLLLLLVLSTVANAAARPELDESEGTLTATPPPSIATVGLFELLELRLPQRLPFKQQPHNPFNFSECRVWASFLRKSADSTSEVVDGFYMTDFRRSFVNETVRYAVHEELTPTGPPAWYVRWTPRQIGSYTYEVHAACANQLPRDVLLKTGTVQATADSSTHELGGFVEAGPNHRHFRLGYSGRSFVPVGQDIAWPTVFNGSFDSDRWMTALAENGGNFARVWLCANLVYGRYDRQIAKNENGKTRTPQQSMVALEQVPFRYEQRAAWRFDQTLRTARRLGIRVLATIESFSTLRTPPALYADWNYSVYNAANNGSVSASTGQSAAAVYFKSLGGAAQYTQRLRYIVARYGWSCNVFGFELWNELTNAFTPVDAECMAAGSGQEWCQYNRSQQDVQRWHAVQHAALNQFDHSRHMVSTSFPALTGDTVVESAMDFSTTHVYDKPDMARSTSGLAEKKATRYNRPSFIGECGIHPQTDDPTGISLENALWAPLFRQAAGSSACWFWNWWVPHYSLWGKFLSVRRFVDTVPWAEMMWRTDNHTYSFIPQGAFVTGMVGTHLNSTGLPTVAVIFMHNENYTWSQRSGSHRSILHVPSTTLKLHGMSDGCYELRWFDCTQGKWLTNTTAAKDRACSDSEEANLLHLATPSFATNIVAKVMRASN